MALGVEEYGAQSASPVPNDLAKKRRHFRAYEQNKSREIEEAREARRYYHGRQWTDAEMRVLKKRGQPVITDNRIGRKVDFLVGVVQRMRRDPKAYPRTPQHTAAADVVTAGVRFVCDINRWEHMASTAAHDGMVSGIGVAWVGIEGEDPKCKLGQVDRFFYDSRSVMPDFSDARHMGMHIWLDADDARARWPEMADAVTGLVDKNSDNGGQFIVDEDRSEQWGDYENNRVRVVEFWERKDTPAGPAWYFCFFSGEVVFESGWSPYLDEKGVPDCPYVAWSPYVDEKGDRYGLVRNMKSIQDEINHRRSKLLHRISVRQIHMNKSAVTVDDVDDFRTEAAKSDGVLSHNGEWGKDVGFVDQSFEAKGEADLLMQAQSALENLGPNPGLVGKGGGVADQSGRAILAQRDSGMTELSPVFERLRDWKLRCYRKMWSRMRQAWQAEKWIRITDENDAPAFIGLNQISVDPATGMPKALNMLAEMDVDIILDEGPDTIVMQEELLQTISQLGEAAVGPLGKVIIELSNVPNKERLFKMMEEANAPPPEMAAMQQRLQHLEEAMKEAMVAKVHSEVEKNRADAISKLAPMMIPPQAMGMGFPVPFSDYEMGGSEDQEQPYMPGPPQQAGMTEQPILPPDMAAANQNPLAGMAPPA